MQSVQNQDLDSYNVSVSVSTDGFTEDSVSTTEFPTTEFPSFSGGSTVYGDYNVTNVTALLSAASSGSFVSRSGVPSGSDDIMTRVVISCVTCVAILLILVPLVIWRCRMFQKLSISSTAIRLVADKYGTTRDFCSFLLFFRLSDICFDFCISVFTAQCTLVHLRGLGIACHLSVRL